MRNKPLIISIIMLLFYSCATQQTDPDKNAARWRYELEGVSTGKADNYLVKIWSYTREPQTVSELAKKNAVHAVIFKGYPSNGAGLPSQEPLIRDSQVEQNQQSYFDMFFRDGGQYVKYVSLVNNGAIGAGDRIKVGKEFKIGIVVNVNKESLRKELQNARIIKGLGDGF